MANKRLYREPNQSRWMGIRPAHNGVPVTTDAGAANTTTNVWTVTVGKTFYLTSATLTLSALAVGTVSLLWRHGASTVFIIARMVIATVIGISPSAPFTPFFPLEIPAGDTVDVVSTAVGLTPRGSIDGWEE